MTILNLYPKGTLEYNKDEIISTGTNNKATIPFNEIISIEFKEPTFFKNGVIVIKSNNKEILCIFAKKRLNDAKIIYEEILEIKNNTKQVIVEEEPEKNNETRVMNNSLECPFCNNTMALKKESGFLGNEYFECESCEVSFNKIGNEKYKLKDYKEKTFLEKHKFTTTVYDDWVKIGQGQYTEDEIKEESELELKETLDIKCPTCDTHFNKYHKKGILTFDSIICPTCKARYEILPPDSYKFINIPNKDSLLWKHYDEKLTLDEIYGIFDKGMPTNIIETKEEKIVDEKTEPANTTNNTEYQPKYCPECGLKITNGAKFCMECGTKLNLENYDKPIDENKEEKSNEETNTPNDTPIEETKTSEQEIKTENSHSTNNTEEIQNKETNITINNTTEENNAPEEITTEKTETLPATKTEESVEPLDTFKEEMLSHDLKTSDLDCPSCDNTMQMYEESGLLSKTTHYYCEKCKIKFKGKEDSLAIEEAPINTRLYEDLRYKHLPLERWKNLLHFGLTDDETKKLSELTAVAASPLFCPSCNHQFVEYKGSGLRSSDYLLCSGCFMRLKKHSENTYSLENTTDNYSPLWKHKNDKLTFEEIKNIYETDTSYLEERKEHVDRINQTHHNIALFRQNLESGNVTLANPINDTTIVLKKGEKPVYRIDDVVLSEPRSVRVSSGGYGGASVRVTDRVTLHSGRADSRSESHDEIKVIDSGELLVTNKRLIFLGSNKTTNIDLNKIIAITESEDSIAIQRSNKQKPEYFSNITRRQTFKLEGKDYTTNIDGELLKMLILGLIE